MNSWCERKGQVEIGVIEHKGRTFAAFGATVQDRHVTGYTRPSAGDIHLSTWCGKTMLACRSTIIDRYHDGSLVLMFRLTSGRFIVGYALGEKGMLFRGELVTVCNDDDAKNVAHRIADRFAELDAQDEYEFQASQAEHERMLDIEYRCPKCGHEWQDQWTSACDSECPYCGLKNITAFSCDEAID